MAPRNEDEVLLMLDHALSLNAPAALRYPRGIDQRPARRSRRSHRSRAMRKCCGAEAALRFWRWEYRRRGAGRIRSLGPVNRASKAFHRRQRAVRQAARRRLLLEELGRDHRTLPYPRRTLARRRLRFGGRRVRLGSGFRLGDRAHRRTQRPGPARLARKTARDVRIEPGVDCHAHRRDRGRAGRAIARAYAPSVSVTRAPPPARLASCSFPPLASTIVRAMASPKPVPPRGRDESPRQNRSVACSRPSGVNPGPSSATSIETRSPELATRSRTQPLSRAWAMALCTIASNARSTVGRSRSLGRRRCRRRQLQRRFHAPPRQPRRACPRGAPSRRHRASGAKARRLPCGRRPAVRRRVLQTGRFAGDGGGAER